MLRPTSPVLIYLGVGATVLGFMIIALAWGKVAAEDTVAFQLPYLVSGGFSGIAFVLVGLTLTAIQSRRIEAAQRADQIAQVAAAVAALRESLSPTDDDAFSLRADAATPESSDGRWERP